MTNKTHKKCNRCKKVKRTTSFYPKKRSYGESLQPYCKPCHSAYQKEYYLKNSKAQLERMYKNRRIRKKKIHNFLSNHFFTNTCVDCAKKKKKVMALLKNKVDKRTIDQVISVYDSDVRNFTFDHLYTRGKKEYNISDMIRDIQPISKIQKELQKCVVRCHNCHDVITVKRSKNWRFHAHKEHKKLVKA